MGYGVHRSRNDERDFERMAMRTLIIWLYKRFVLIPDLEEALAEELNNEYEISFAPSEELQAQLESSKQKYKH